MRNENGIVKDTKGDHSGLLAGVAKSATFAIVSAPSMIAKGVIKWFFHSPIRFFRPYAVSPWHVLEDMARHEGKSVGLSYLRTLYTTDGFRVVSSNFWPLMVLNSISGFLLFTTYRVSHELLIPRQLSPDTCCEGDKHAIIPIWIPFVSGATSGVAVSVLITPVHNIRALATPRDLVVNRHSGIIRYSSFLLGKLFLNQSGVRDKGRLLFKSLAFTSLRDALCYSLFFGTFENLCNLAGSFYVQKERYTANNELILGRTTSRAGRIIARIAEMFVPTLTAGASAGIVYNLAHWPFQTYRKVVKETVRIHDCHAMETKITLAELYATIRKRGIRPFYDGIRPQLIRVVTPSAIGLFVYRITTEDYT